MQAICSVNDIVPNTGVCALVDDQQVAVFRVVKLDNTEQFYAVANLDPFSQANVLSRGLVGAMGDDFYIASPIYKQRFDLVTGNCLDDDSVQIPVYEVAVKDGMLYI